ncbi:MAG: hypothetical protein GF409_05955 [Candidatus Omnitrophica bacterium]|nr:hypothetical protein [Candidatus Omnitrophota bacterium]
MQENTRSRVMTAVDLATHAVISIMLAAFFYFLTRKWTWALLAIAGGVFIDLDHLFDYFRFFGFRFSLRDFFDHKYLASGKCFILLHSWEVIAAAWLVSVLVEWMVPVATGMSLHLLVDYLYSHRGEARELSLIYRWRNSFSLSCVSKHK